MIGRALAVAVSGLKANALRANVAAANIVNLNTPGFEGRRTRAVGVTTNGAPARDTGVRAEIIGDGPVGLATEFTRLIEAEIAYRASAGVIRTAEEIARETIDLVA